MRSNQTNDVENDIKKQIMDNLMGLGISSHCIKRIMDAVDKMPAKEHVQGALKFLTQLTNKKSKREEYYKYSPYIAEYFCTISNLGLFAVAFYYNDYAVLFAATCSALSHAIPSQRLHDLDILGELIIFAKAIDNYKLIMERPDILAWGAGAMTINVMDTFITRKYLDKIGSSLHVTWHFAAAFALHKFNQIKIEEIKKTEITNEELQSLFSAIQSNTVPSFLNAAHDEITKHIYNLSNTSNCTIL